MSATGFFCTTEGGASVVEVVLVVVGAGAEAEAGAGSPDLGPISSITA